MGVRQHLEGLQDLSRLEPPTEDAIVACLRERYMADTIYTRIGPSVLVAFNPHKHVSSSSDSIMQGYISEYYSTSTQEQDPLPPHIFQLACNAFYDMKRTNQDQSIVFT